MAGVHISLQVGNLEESTEFYSRFLGKPAKKKPAQAGARRQPTDMPAQQFVCAATGVPVRFIRINCVAGRVLLVMKLNGIEDEELCFGAEISRVGQPCEFKIAFGARGD